jgi:hypothetical protein
MSLRGTDQRRVKNTARTTLMILASAACCLAASAQSIKIKSVDPDSGQVLVEAPSSLLVHRQVPTDFKPTAAYKWLDIILSASGRDAIRNKPRPNVLSRADGIVLTAMYDAWAAYDAVAVGTRLGSSLRRPERERTAANREKAIGQAVYRTLMFVFPEEGDWIRTESRAMGVEVDNATTDPGTPQGVGNAAANALIAYRSHDGSNQLGTEKGGDGKPYSDYTGYRPHNTPTAVKDPTRWMPIPFSDGKGGRVSPGYLGAQWGNVKPVALQTPAQFRPPPPPQWGSDELNRDLDEVIFVNANLSLQQKAIVEFMREGPRSTGQSGHWLQFAQDISRRDRHDLEKDVKLYFVVGNVVMDSFIACWEAKRFYDTSRPYWWVRQYAKGKQIEAWGGPGKGVIKLDGENWVPYSPEVFVTPPFPGYPSGHATASGAAARALELFTGSDAYGAVAYHRAGALTEPGDFGVAQLQGRYGKPGTDPADSPIVRLSLPTFTSVAEMAAVSRLWGGFHIRTDNDQGLVLGRRIAMFSLPVYQSYFNGTAKINQ